MIKIVEKYNEKCTLLLSPGWVKMIGVILSHIRNEIDEIEFQSRLGVPLVELDELLARLQPRPATSTDIFELECGSREQFSGMVCLKFTSPELMIIRQSIGIIVNSSEDRQPVSSSGFENRRLKTLVNILDMLIV